MSLPITPTPILEGKEADNFLRRVEEGLKDPVGSVPTPKLGKAMELVKQISKERKMKDKEKIERLSDALAFSAAAALAWSASCAGTMLVMALSGGATVALSGLATGFACAAAGLAGAEAGASPRPPMPDASLMWEGSEWLFEISMCD